MKKLIFIFACILSLGCSAQTISFCLQPSCKQTIKTTDTATIFAILTATDGYKNISWSFAPGSPTFTIPQPVTTWQTSLSAQSSFPVKSLPANTYILQATGTSLTGITATVNDTLVVQLSPRRIIYNVTVYSDSSRVITQ